MYGDDRVVCGVNSRIAIGMERDVVGTRAISVVADFSKLWIGWPHLDAKRRAIRVSATPGRPRGGLSRPFGMADSPALVA